jgi:hypothetical protein
MEWIKTRFVSPSYGLGASLALLLMPCAMAAQAGEMRLEVTRVGAPIALYEPAKQGCDANDIPDAPLRAFRAPDGKIIAFGLHYDNRRLLGPSLNQLRAECAVVYASPGRSDPRAYDDRAWIAATFSPDGKQVHALVHHEFQAHRHPGRCSSRDYMACWWNSILAIRSRDGGQNFERPRDAVIAATPEPSEIGQGRHRGFFNPSNIIPWRGNFYALIATTGWDGQRSGACLFRADRLTEPNRWRAWDGSDFTARFSDPYASRHNRKPSCKPVAPFPAPVGSVTRHEPSGLFLAVFQAAAGMPDGTGGRYATSGLYITSSPDLKSWAPARLLVEARSLYDNPCGARVLLNYPSILDPTTLERNFAATSDTALLTYTEITVEGCQIRHQRRLLAERIRISTFRAE